MNWTTLWQLSAWAENIVYFIYCTVPYRTITSHLCTKYKTYLHAFILNVISFLSLSVTIHACSVIIFVNKFQYLQIDLVWIGKWNSKWLQLSTHLSFFFLCILASSLYSLSLTRFFPPSFYLAVLSHHQYHFYRSI